MDVLDLKRPGKRQSVKDTLVRWIQEQGLKPGDRIQSQNELARHFGVTAVTVCKALTELAREGVLHRIDGKGTFVGPEPRAIALKTACLVLPGRDLDQPEANPDYWPHVRQLLLAFHDALTAPWRFTTLAVPPGTRPEDVAPELALDDAVFFHYSKEPYNLLHYLVHNRVVPVIAFGMPRPDLPCLTLDHGVVEGVRRSVAYLAGLGYRRIAYVGSHEDWGRFWFDGYRKGLADAGLPEDPACVVALGQQTQASGAQAATELLRRGLPCDVIMADSDMRALGLIEQLRLDGVRVPQDVGVMGYDGLENVTRQPPYLASFRKPMEQMIRAGIAVVEGLEDRATPELHETFLGQLVPGRTVRGDGSNQ